MLFDNNLTGLIQNPVGNNQENKDEDVRNIRIGLEEAGDLAGEENEERDYIGRPLGMITQKLEDGIRGFQRRNDLKEDGKILPRGETENALILNIKERAAKEKPLTRMPGGLRVNKDNILDGLGEFILAQANASAEEKSPESDAKKRENLKQKQAQDIPPKPEKKQKQPAESYPSKVKRQKNKERAACSPQQVEAANAAAAFAILQQNLNLKNRAIQRYKNKYQTLENELLEKEEELKEVSTKIKLGTVSVTGITGGIIGGGVTKSLPGVLKGAQKGAMAGEEVSDRLITLLEAKINSIKKRNARFLEKISFLEKERNQYQEKMDNAKINAETAELALRDCLKAQNQDEH